MFTPGREVTISGRPVKEVVFTPGGVLSNAAQMGPTQPILDPARPTGYYDWPNRLGIPAYRMAGIDAPRPADSPGAKRAVRAPHTRFTGVAR